MSAADGFGGNPRATKLKQSDYYYTEKARIALLDRQNEELRKQRDELAALLAEVLADPYTDFRKSLDVKCRAALARIPF